MKRHLLFLCATLLAGLIYGQQYELDNSYITGTGFNGEVNVMELDSNGKLLVGGDFTEYNGTAVTYLVRLNADGTIDGTYTPTLTSGVDDFTLHSGDTITVVTAGALKRFTPTGALDATYTPASANNVIYTVDAIPNSLEVIIGGNFTDIGTRIAKLDEDGIVDATFKTNTGTGFNSIVRAIDIASNGKIIAGGDFTTFSNVTRNKLTQLNSDGTLDINFSPSMVYNVYSVAVQDDGKVLAGNSSTSARVARLNADGTVESSGSTGSNAEVFDIYTNGTDDVIAAGNFSGGIGKWDYSTFAFSGIASGKGVEGSLKEINTFAVQTDGSIIIGGDFTTYDGFTANNFARISQCGVSLDVAPVAATVCENLDTSYTLTATGTGTLSYLWQINTNSGVGLFSDITNDATYGGATTNTLAITSTQLSMDGYFYRCVITDDNCSSTTSAYILNVNAAQVITADPADYEACAGSNAPFSITYTGAVGTWQWQVDTGTGTFTDLENNDNVSGATLQGLTLISVADSMNGYKYRLVSNACEQTLTSALATLTVAPTPEITSISPNQYICVTGNASFTVEATDALTYKWQYYVSGNLYSDLTDGGVYSGTNTATLTLTGAGNALAELYDKNNSDGSTYAMFRCIVTSNSCYSISATTLLYIHDVPTVTVQPINADLCNNGSGASSDFRVTSSITQGMVYQWQVDDGSGFEDVVDDTVYSGSDNNRLNFSKATSAFSDNLYRCIVGACATPVISDNAILTISNKPVVSNESPIAQVNICEGSDTTFTFDATEDASNSYQWQKYEFNSWTNLTDDDHNLGVNSNSLDLLNILGTGSSTVNYRCVITNGTCETITSNFSLRTNSTPSFTSQPRDVETCEDSYGNFIGANLSGFNTSYNTYQWQEEVLDGVFGDIADGNLYTNTQTKQLHVDSASTLMNGKRYILKVFGCVAEVVSDTVTLTVNDSTRITSQPVDSTVLCEGESTKFGITATGTNLIYLWAVNGSTQGMSQHQTDTLLLSNLNSASTDGNLYYCTVRGKCGTGIVSASALLRVRAATNITNNYTQAIVCLGSDTAFATEAVGHNINYSWSNGGSILSDDDTYSGTNTNRLQITSVTAEMVGSQFNCTVSGTCGDDIEKAMGVINIPGLTTQPEIYEDNSNPDAIRLLTNYNGYKHNWYKDGEYYTDSYGELFPTEDGSYTVTVVGDESYGCESPMSEPYVFGNPIAVKGISDNNDVVIFPNPSNGNFTINGINSDYKIKVLNIIGETIIKTKQGSSDYSLDLTGYNNGIYFVEILDTKQNTIKHIRIIKE